MKKVLFSGGGTLGPVTPLLAIHDVLQDAYKDVLYVWVGTTHGPEKNFIEENNIKFKSIQSGKFRRYFSLLNFVDIFKVLIGFFQACIILHKEDPDLCISAGGFVSVPIHWAAWFMGVPTWVHQQDIEVGLANKIMATTASIVTTSTESNLKKFKCCKTELLGSPVRQEILCGSRERAISRFNLNGKLPVLFATGGGTGSLRVNQIIAEAVQGLEGVCEIIHLTGKERPQEMSKRMGNRFSHYHAFDFFKGEMKDAYAVANVVIARGGFGTLTELAALGKPSIIIPKHGHQETNVKYLAKSGALLWVDEETFSGYQLSVVIKNLLSDSIKQKQLSKKLQTLLPLATPDSILRIVKKITA